LAGGVQHGGGGFLRGSRIVSLETTKRFPTRLYKEKGKIPFGDTKRPRNGLGGKGEKRKKNELVLAMIRRRRGGVGL